MSRGELKEILVPVFGPSVIRWPGKMVFVPWENGPAMNPNRRPVFTVIVLLCLGAGPGPSIRLSKPGDPRAAVEAVGLDPATLAALASDPGRAGQVLAVSTVSGPSNGGDGRPPLLGSYRVDTVAGVLRFQPRFPLEPGVRYRAVLSCSERESRAGLCRVHVASAG